MARPIFLQLLKKMNVCKGYSVQLYGKANRRPVLEVENATSTERRLVAAISDVDSALPANNWDVALAARMLV